MKPSHLHGTNCRPVAEILSRVGDKWSVILVMELHGGTTVQQASQDPAWYLPENAHHVAARIGARREAHSTLLEPDLRAIR